MFCVLFSVGKLALILLLTVAIFTPRVAGDSLKQVVSEREQDRLKQLLTTESNWRDLHTSYLSVKGLESVGASITREVSNYWNKQKTTLPLSRYLIKHVAVLRHQKNWSQYFMLRHLANL